MCHLSHISPWICVIGETVIPWVSLRIQLFFLVFCIFEAALQLYDFISLAIWLVLQKSAGFQMDFSFHMEAEDCSHVFYTVMQPLFMSSCVSGYPFLSWSGQLWMKSLESLTWWKVCGSFNRANMFIPSGTLQSTVSLDSASNNESSGL